MKMEAKGRMVISTPAHYYESPQGDKAGPYHVVLEMDQKGYFPPSFTFSYAIYKGTTAPFQRVLGRELTTFSYLDRAKQPLVKRPGYMHCYAQTANYVILFISRNRLKYEKLLAFDMSEGFFGWFTPEDVPLEFMVFKVNRAAVSLDQELE